MVAIHGLNGDAKLPTIIYSRNDNRWMFCFGKLRFGRVHVLARSDDLSGDCSCRSLFSRCFEKPSQTFVSECINTKISIQILFLKSHRENGFGVTEQLQNLSRMCGIVRSVRRRGEVTSQHGRQVGRRAEIGSGHPAHFRSSRGHDASGHASPTPSTRLLMH